MLAILDIEPEGNKGQEPQFVIDEREEGAAGGGQLAVLCNAEFEAGSRWRETLNFRPRTPGSLGELVQHKLLGPESLKSK